MKSKGVYLPFVIYAGIGDGHCLCVRLIFEFRIPVDGSGRSKEEHRWVICTSLKKTNQP